MNTEVIGVNSRDDLRNALQGADAYEVLLHRGQRDSKWTDEIIVGQSSRGDPLTVTRVEFHQMLDKLERRDYYYCARGEPAGTQWRSEHEKNVYISLRNNSLYQAARLNFEVRTAGKK